MPRCCLLGGLVFGLLWGVFRPAPAAAGDLLGWLKGDRRSHTAEHLAGAEPGMPVTSAARLYPAFSILGPRHRYIPGVPSFNWGYFGAAHRPTHFCHKGYHGDCVSWSYRPR